MRIGLVLLCGAQLLAKNPDFSLLDYVPQTDWGYPDHLEEETSLKECNPAWVDLEATTQDFVLEVKKIEIPKYKDAFNPSLVRWKGKILLSFRTYDPKTRSTHKIGLVFLDEQLNIISEPQLLEIPSDGDFFLEKRQDPRLIVIGDRLFIVYNNQLRFIREREIRRMLFAELIWSGSLFFAQPAQPLLEYTKQSYLKTEKNWVPFSYQDQLMLSYSLSPHLVIHPMNGKPSCEMLAETKMRYKWPWGDLRGGTPALLQENGDYLAFFHSSLNLPSAHSSGRVVLHYFMGAYTFSSHPPFEINRISPCPIVGKGFYEGPDYKTWKPLRVVFPGGFITDSQFIWLAYGRQDHETWIVKLDKKKLMNSLVPIE